MRIHPSHILVYYIILPYDYNLYLPRGGDLVHTARDLRVSLGLTILGPTPLGSLIPSGIHKWSPTHLTVWYITVLVVNWHVHCQCHAPLSITRTSSSTSSYVQSTGYREALFWSDSPLLCILIITFLGNSVPPINLCFVFSFWFI